MIVDPKPGAGGVLAVNELSLAPRDGHTLLVGVISLVSEIPHILKLPVDMANEIKPIGRVARGGLVLVGNAVAARQDAARAGRLREGQPGQGQLRLVHGRARCRT